MEKDVIDKFFIEENIVITEDQKSKLRVIIDGLLEEVYDDVMENIVK